jgi:type II secretory ATPase GspE/PulE/Tfp pilus assembly ATPase PilB-like protein
MNDFLEQQKEEEEALHSIRRGQEEKRAQDLAITRNLVYVDLLRVPVEVDALNKVPEQKARGGAFVPFQLVNRRLAIAAIDDQNDILKSTIVDLEKKGFKIETLICSVTSLKRGLDEYKKLEKFQKQISHEFEVSSQGIAQIEERLKEFVDVEQELGKAKSVSTTAFLEVLMGSAIKFDASDIHIIPGKEETKTRYRIDGDLHDVFSVDANFYSSLLSRVKILADLKINIHDQAQDGRFTIGIDDKDVETRVSIVPGAYGEDIVLRILNPKMLLSIEQLGLHSWYEKTVLEQMKKPTGMILTCGPTGSGKTTTLYACLKHIAIEETKILTIEDPIEYHLKNIDQTQVEAEKGYDFASALRAALRQDPDIILVGEIRDPETANTAVQAALTGHLVFSTLHTNDAAGIVPRLTEMGVNPSTIAAALNLSISQRLVKTVCKKCAKSSKPDDRLLEKIKKALFNVPKEYFPENILKNGEVDFSNVEVLTAVGCKECFNTGYKGRIGIYEMFKVTPKIEEVINSSPSISEMDRVIREEGMVTIQQDSLLRVLEKETTIEEIESVLGPLE